MIDFRYHLVSIIAIFFALATGIVLGAGPLGEQVDQTLVDQMADIREENQRLHDEVTGLETDRAYQEVFIAEVYPELVGSRLDGRDVVVVALPGAGEQLVEDVTDALSAADARISTIATVQEQWTESDSDAALDALASELVSAGTTLPEEGTGYDRASVVLAGALLAAPDDPEDGAEDAATEQEEVTSDLPASEAETTEPPPVDNSVLVGFREAGFISVTEEPESKAAMAVLVAGPPPEDDVEDAVGTIGSLARAFDGAGAGAVVAGPPAAAREQGLLASLRADEDVAGQISTVDSADLPSGRVAVVYALAEQEGSGAGQYGVVGTTDAAVPPVPPRQEPDETTEDES